MKYSKTVFSTFLIALPYLAPPQAFALDFESPESYPCSGFINISGKIEKGDDKKFLRFLSAYHSNSKSDNCKPKSYTINLKSPGGDVETGMEIGRTIRGLGSTSVTTGFCASACIFMFAGGNDRTSLKANNQYGLGLHRFYLAEPNINSSTATRNSRETLKGKITSFLREMDISERVLDLSEGIPPEKIKWLTDKEAEELRLEGRDATYDEIESAKEARGMGLTLSEYRLRKARSKAKCDALLAEARGLIDYKECHTMIMWGLSTKELDNQRTNLFERCTTLAGKMPTEYNSPRAKVWAQKVDRCKSDNPVLAR